MTETADLRSNSIIHSPVQSLEAFLRERAKVTNDPLKPLYPNKDEALDAAIWFLSPFMQNPEQHKEAIRLLLRGVCTDCVLLEFQKMEATRLAIALARLFDAKLGVDDA